MKTIAPTLRRSFKLKALILATLLPGLSVLPVPLQANPYGPNVVAGGANFQGLGTANLNINQTSNTAIINWQGFSIANGEVTTFNQPGVNAVALNRVVNGDPSAIYGTLQANGSILVINPNGIVVGPGGVVDVAGMLTMSTLDIDDDDFLDGGSNRFQGATGAGITNYGAVSSSNGDVVFLGNFLQNAGSVSAPDGTVAFGAGGDILVEQGISGATISVQGAGPGGDIGINNSGTVSGAAVEFETTGNAYGLAIQNTGVIRATGAKVRGGRVMLSAGSQGSIMNTGQISARNYDGSGGTINIQGDNVLLEAGALEATGANGMIGGSIDVSGRNISVGETATLSADGAIGGAIRMVAASAASFAGGASAVGSVGNGGNIDLTGSAVTVEGNSVIDVSGEMDGGSARVGGGFQGNASDLANSQTTDVEAGALIIADGNQGNGGSVILWSDGDSTFYGDISAQANGIGNGGFVEVSGKRNLAFRGWASTLSQGGLNGTILLDPENVTIGPATGDPATEPTIVDTVLVGLLGSSNVVVHTSDISAPALSGDITVLVGADLVTNYNVANDLTLLADRNIVILDDVQNQGTGNINLFAGWDNTTGIDIFNSSINPSDQDPSTDPIPEIGFTEINDNKIFGEWGTDKRGSITINGSNNTDDVSIGSAQGQTNLFAYDVNIYGGSGNSNNPESKSAQVGYRNATHTVTGDINVIAKRDIRISAPGLSANVNRNNAFAMIGHGGSNYVGTNNNNPSQGATAGDGDLAGNITVAAGIAGDGGDVVMVANGRIRNNSAQIGHGGHSIEADTAAGFSGNINVTGTNLLMTRSAVTGGAVNSGVLIGHGGWLAIGAKTGDIRVVMTDDITGVSGFSSDTSTAAGVFTQIGHGVTGQAWIPLLTSSTIKTPRFQLLQEKQGISHSAPLL